MISQVDCIGCQACVDFCPQKAISFQYDKWGEGKAVVDLTQCNNCGLCELRCPGKINTFNEAQKRVYAAVSREHRYTGSSGGVFYELASQFIRDGGVVFGAAFDENLKLIHKKATTTEELLELCKSKYLHSDMSGVYAEISNCLKNGQKVMFVGTPCQTSAVKNLFIKKYEHQLVLVDFLCHGTGTQKIFDMCVKEEEKRKNGKIVEFVFRAKSKRAEHSFRYKLKNGNKIKTVSGYSFEFPYYYSYLKYNIFNESCYECKYTSCERVGDITLGDFWGIQNYDKKLKDCDGVSMLSLNTQKGKELFEQIRFTCDVYEYPIENAANNNQAFRESVGEHIHNSKRELLKVLESNGETALMEKMSCPNIRKNRIYAKTPMFVKKAWDYIRGKR